MSWTLLGAVLVVVFSIATGQVLVKLAAAALPPTAPTPGDFLDVLTSPLFLSAVVLYGAAVVLWTWVLRHAELSRVYPFVALTFILVPAAGIMIFNEKATLGLGIGTALILLGVAIVAQS